MSSEWSELAQECSIHWIRMDESNTEGRPQGDGPIPDEGWDALLAGMDWAKTRLGPRAGWPAALETVVGVCLGSLEPMAVWWGPEFTLVHNEAYAEILRDRHPGALGRSASEVWPEIWETIGPIFRDVLADRSAARFEDEPFEIGPDGAHRTRWFSFALSTIPDGNGGIGGVFNLVQETTDSVRARTKLEEGRAHAVKAARLLAVSKLAGAVAHEFNNVLTVLEGRADILLGELEEDSPLREDVRAITTAGRRATALTDRLLAFGRQQVFRESTIRLDEVVFEWADQVARVVPGYIELRLAAPSESVSVRADPTQIERVVFELVANSVQAMEGRAGVVELAVTQVQLSREDVDRIPWEVAPGAYGQMILAHDGPGMSADELQHLFEPFVHSDPGKVAAGLGLAAVFGIVKQSGGHIFVESPPGGGRTIRMLLPKVADEGLGDTRRRGVGPSHADRFPPRTILLVEDDEGVRHTARKVLEREGWSVVEAGNGDEALGLVSDQVSLVLSDVRMPGLNGPGLCRELARTHPDIKLLLMSGYVDVRDQIADLDVPLLSKPFTVQTLIETVRARLADG